MDTNILVLGADNVGKTAITVRLLTRRFIGEYGDMESIYCYKVIIDGREIPFNIWDPAYSQESVLCQSSVQEKQILWADGFVLVYSICDRASFNAVARQIHHIRSTKDSLGVEKVPIVIVGNKRDLQHCREVSSEEGRLLGLATDCPFYEVSAAENYQSILTMFHGLINRVKEYKCAVRRPAGIKGIVKSMSAVFTRKQTDSL
ncbi:ras-related and estrogen-regulated growth inhibitor-like protein [Arapaima gigas]